MCQLIDYLHMFTKHVINLIQSQRQNYIQGVPEVRSHKLYTECGKS